MDHKHTGAHAHSKKENMIHPTSKIHCNHKFVHMETKKTPASRPSIGYKPAQDWVRTDLFFCEKCLEYKTVTKTWDWMTNDTEPSGW